MEKEEWGMLKWLSQIREEKLTSPWVRKLTVKSYKSLPLKTHGEWKMDWEQSSVISVLEKKHGTRQMKQMMNI